VSKSAHLQFTHDSFTYMIEVARGNVPGAQIMASHGELTTTGAVEDHLIWPVAGTPDLAVPPEEGVQLSIVSDSVNDTDGGTGARALELHYLNGDLNIRNETITLNGTTPVLSAATDIRFVECMHVHEYGALKEADGNIDGTHSGTTYTYIAAGKRRCTNSARRIPAGKRLFIHALWGGSVSGTAAASTTVRLVSTQLDRHDYTEDAMTIPHAAISVQDSSESLTSLAVMSFPAGSVVGLECTTDKGATITAGFAGWIENE